MTFIVHNRDRNQNWIMFSGTSICARWLQHGSRSFFLCLHGYLWERPKAAAALLCCSLKRGLQRMRCLLVFRWWKPPSTEFLWADLHADLTACLACCNSSSAFSPVDVSCPMDEQGVRYFLEAAVASRPLPCLTSCSCQHLICLWWAP